LRVPEPDDRPVLPAGTERFTIQVHLEVGQADVELGVRHREDLLVEGERIDADAERRGAGPVAEQVLAPLQAVDVGVQETEPRALGFHLRSFGAERSSTEDSPGAGSWERPARWRAGAAGENRSVFVDCCARDAQTTGSTRPSGSESS